jgi:hypothetical protein
MSALTCDEKLSYLDQKKKMSEFLVNKNPLGYEIYIVLYLLSSMMAFPLNYNILNKKS